MPNGRPITTTTDKGRQGMGRPSRVVDGRERSADPLVARISASTRAATTATVVAVVAVAIGVSACTGSSTDGSSTETTAVSTSARESVIVAPDAETFEVEDGTATLACQGAGLMPVILIAGIGDPIDRWDAVVDDLGQGVLACRFAPPTGPDIPLATPARNADALSQTLDASGLPGPYLLVAHYLGGLTARRFGDRHPDKLGAALFLDATTPTALLSVHNDLTAAGWDAAATQADSEAPASWPDVPLTVFAHDPAGEPLGLGPDVERLWSEGQRTYITLTDDAHFEQVDGAGHYIDLDRTRRVTNEIIELVDQAT